MRRAIFMFRLPFDNYKNEFKYSFFSDISMEENIMWCHSQKKSTETSFCPLSNI